MQHRCASLLIVVATLALSACSSAPESSNLTELQRTKAGNLDVVLLAKNEALASGKGEATLEFQNGSDHQLVEVGTVKVGASMEMAGMGPMVGSVFVKRSDAPGRYSLDTDLGMAGTWRLKVDWSGPAGTGSVTFPGTVR